MVGWSDGGWLHGVGWLAGGWWMVVGCGWMFCPRKELRFQFQPRGRRVQQRQNGRTCPTLPIWIICRCLGMLCLATLMNFTGRSRGPMMHTLICLKFALRSAKLPEVYRLDLDYIAAFMHDNAFCMINSHHAFCALYITPPFWHVRPRLVQYVLTALPADPGG